MSLSEHYHVTKCTLIVDISQNLTYMLPLSRMEISRILENVVIMYFGL